jgi:hypothetical protein
MSTAKVIDCTVEGEIAVNLPGGSSSLNVGGLAGEGNISHSRVTGPLNITVTAGGTGSVAAGGLTGVGTAEYSFIGTKNNHAKLTVNRTGTGTAMSEGSGSVYVGGISGYAPLTAGDDWGTPAALFQYNYAFCDVTLETTAAAKSTMAMLASQSVGGLAGYVSSSSYGDDTLSFNESYAAGSVTLVNNYAGGDTDAEFYAGGILGNMDYQSWVSGITFTLSKCAALNSEVVINGSNTAAPKNWRRIANSGEGKTTFTNNITTVTQTAPSSYAPEDDADKGDGLLITALTADTFFGAESQLKWDTTIWKWEDGYPVFK